MFSSLLRQLLPHQCPLCLQRCTSYLCQECLNSLPYIDKACRQCGLPLEAKHQTCADCIKQIKPYTLTISPLLYSHPVDHLIHRFKSQSPGIISQQLAPFLLPQIQELYSLTVRPDALVPVPLHWRSKFKRGFNQAHCLADTLSALTRIPCQPIVSRVLRSKNQKSLNRQHRLLNLGGSFYCSADLKGQHLVIIDDVVTTCATAIHMANVLLNAGADRIDVWALARTPK